jgi:hypothetical protein
MLSDTDQLYNDDNYMETKLDPVMKTKQKGIIGANPRGIIGAKSNQIESALNTAEINIKNDKIIEFSSRYKGGESGFRLICDINNTILTSGRYETELTKLIYVIFYNSLTRNAKMLNVLTNDINSKINGMIISGDLCSMSKINKSYNFIKSDLLHKCIYYGDTTILYYLLINGGKIDQTLSGKTLFEYAYKLKDESMIDYLINIRDFPEKITLLRDLDITDDYVGNDMDIAIAQKIILDQAKRLEENHVMVYLDFVKNSVNNEYITYLKNIPFDVFLNAIDCLISNISKRRRNEYISILSEEINYAIENRIDCPDSIVSVIIYNLIPFIKYQYNITSEWLLLYEFKMVIFNNKNVSLKNLIDILKFKYYTINKIIRPKYIEILFSKLLNEISK